MTPPVIILYKVLVKPFYKQNAGLLLFVLIMMFGIVNEMDGADIFDYHYALIMGMFANDLMFGLVLLVWLIYAYKCAGFAINSFQKPENSFLYIYSFRPAKELFFPFLLVQLLLFLPVLLYVIAIISVAFHNHFYAGGSFIITCMLLICCISAWWYVYHIRHWGKAKRFRVLRSPVPIPPQAMYGFFLLRYLFNKKKLLLSGIKIYTCGVLYLIIRNTSSTYYDIATPFIFYSFGMLAHGVLIQQLRDYEEQYLFFYRSLPVPLYKRLLNYILLCGLLLLPEAVTMVFISPSHLLLPDAILFVVSGYAIVLLLSGILFYYACTMLDYLRLSFVILCVIYLLLIMHLFYFLPLLCISIAVILFIRGYYNYEKKNTGNIVADF